MLRVLRVSVAALGTGYGGNRASNTSRVSVLGRQSLARLPKIRRRNDATMLAATITANDVQ